jgi:hypothetical protein
VIHVVRSKQRQHESQLHKEALALAHQAGFSRAEILDPERDILPERFYFVDLAARTVYTAYLRAPYSELVKPLVVEGWQVDAA